MSRSRLHELSEHGVSVWIDSLSREMLETGELARLVEEDAVVGVTSNPTIFQKALAEGDWYDEQLRKVAAQTDDTTELFLALAEEDVRDACDLLAPVWERTQGIDGRVSLEVDPTLAYDREATFAQATRFHAEVDRPNLYVKIPGTEPGLGAIEDSIAAANAINVTLIFGLDRYAAVVEAYIRGLERLVEAGGDPASVLSVASFFVSRVDTEADRRLEDVGRPDLKGKLAVANAKLAYQHWKEAFSGDRWASLAAAGARSQRCLWASTSTKNPAYRDVLYVEDLVGPDVVNTMPIETVRAFQDHGEVRDTLDEGVDEARALLDGAGGGGRRLRRRGRDTRARGRTEVRRLVRGAARGHRGQGARGRRPVGLTANPLEEGLGLRRKPDPCALVIFGASGDLTHRKLFPALYALAYRRLLPERFAVVGVARTEQTTEQFEREMREAVQRHGARPVQQSRLEPARRRAPLRRGRLRR